MSDAATTPGQMGDSPERVRGKICCVSAYIQGKALDHSKWQLPGRKSLSDIDYVLDNNGYVLYFELARAWWPIGWDSVSPGQRWLYLSICRASEKCAVVLARHAVVSLEEAIDTRNDILDAVVRLNCGMSEAKLTGDEYRKLVELWAADAVAALAWLKTLAAAQQEAKP